MAEEKQGNRSRVLHLLRYLYEFSDENHQKTIAELIQELTENDLKGNRITVRHDIDMMVEEGFDIVINEGLPGSFYWGAKTDLETPELKLLIDAVSSSRFISESKSQELISKLINLAGITDGKKLAARIFTVDKMKADNQQIYIIVDIISQTIDAGKQLQFKYYDYNEKKEKILRHDGEIYTASPYAMVWEDDRYYMLAYSEKHKKVVPFRVDRICRPVQLEADRVPEPEGFNIEDYASKIFDMYDGDDQTVVLECKNELMRVLVDSFGEDFTVESAGKDAFRAIVNVSTSKTFYAWVFKFRGQVKILKPESVATEYRKMLEEALSATKE